MFQLSFRTIAFLLVALSLLIPRAFSGEAATLNILGFSADGNIFAFEEYGVQDGSGFPYANRFYIAVDTDSFVAGSPIRVRVEDETATVQDAREQAKVAGQVIINDDILAANQGLLAGFNPVTEASADPFRMAVNPRQVVPPIDARLEVRLEEKPFLPSGNCEGITDAVYGFRLLQIATEPNNATRVLSDDQGVPNSRGCPLGYAIGGIQTIYPQNADPAFAVLIAIRSFGFEGPDFRWMAVTARMMP
ncbi:MAG: DUF2259 domain-containing protein [Pseudomonadota bacterium]